ncbi:MAG: amino acid permease [Rudaea sp.]|uniref:amino acid permease n=1 Tax=unclassified Rudaea TaxID=2627037 RepID=UPI0010F927EA|nr:MULTISPECIES: amino acid permease [unclassified Rudaea]MBN8887259.1 amino acid permease [Rudaea sp.]
MSTSRRALGLWSATALVVGNMIGSGVFLLPASLAPYGQASLYGWALSATGALLLAGVFAYLSRRHPIAGGPYAYARIAFGEFTGFIMAWSYWISVWCAVAAIAVAFAGSMAVIFPALALPGREAACALIVLWLGTAFNIAGVRTAGIAQLVITILKLVPLFVVIAVGATRLDAASFTPFNPSGQGWLPVTTITAALALWALQGMECATIPAEHVTDAEKTIARATFIGVALAAVVTIAACTVVLGLVPLDRLKMSTAPFADAATRLWGSGAGVAMAAAMAVSCLGALNGWILVQGQVPYAAARDGLFPAYFAKVDAHGTPRIGLVVGSVLATVLVVANFAGSLVAVFTASILLATAAALLPYAFSAAAMLKIEWQSREPSAWRLAVAGFALVYGIWALIGTGAEALLWGAGLLLAALPFYVLRRREYFTRSSA